MTDLAVVPSPEEGDGEQLVFDGLPVEGKKFALRSTNNFHTHHVLVKRQPVAFHGTGWVKDVQFPDDSEGKQHRVHIIEASTCDVEPL